MKYLLMLSLVLSAFSFNVSAQETDDPVESDVTDEKNEDLTDIPAAQKQTERPEEAKIQVGPYTKDGEYNYQSGKPVEDSSQPQD